MKRYGLLSIIFLFAVLSMHAQVGINTTGASPEESAILDISSVDKGLLIPRMEITDVDSDLAPVENPIEGLLIYNNGTTDGIPKGFYYWSGSKWTFVTVGTSAVTINQLSGLYESAELYEDNGWGSPTTISLVSSSQFYGWISATEGETFGSTSTDIGHSTADRIIIGEEGLYEVDLSVSFGGTNNARITVAVFHTPDGGSAAKTRICSLTKLKANGDLEACATHGLIRLGVDDTIDIRFNATSGGESLSIYNVSLILNKVGE